MDRLILVFLYLDPLVLTRINTNQICSREYTSIRFLFNILMTVDIIGLSFCAMTES